MWFRACNPLPNVCFSKKKLSRMPCWSKWVQTIVRHNHNSLMFVCLFVVCRGINKCMSQITQVCNVAGAVVQLLMAIAAETKVGCYKSNSCTLIWA